MSDAPDATDAVVPTRVLGTSGLAVSAQGLGCMGMSQHYGPADRGESMVTLHRALERGVCFFDTADVYGDGHNETLLGEFLAGDGVRQRRDEIVVATKFALRSDAGGPMVVNGRPDYVRASCEASLHRLGVDHIDLYYQHRVDPSVPIEETVGAMADLVAAGHVRHLGLSEASARTIDRAVAVHPITALQSEWSLWTRDLEAEVLAAARRHGIGIVPFSPLGRGFLTGTLRSTSEFGDGDFRAGSPRFQAESFDANLAIVDEVRRLADELGCTAGQLALGWVMAQGDDVVPIPGTKRSTYLDQNADACFVELSQDVLDRLAAIVPPGAATGARYPFAHTYGDSPER